MIMSPTRLHVGVEGGRAVLPAPRRAEDGEVRQLSGWRRNRLRAASGFTIDALGLDTAARGMKLEDQRPDFMVVDDIDDSEDSPGTVRKKARILTKKIIPAGAKDPALLMCQNLIHANSVFSRILDG